MSVTHFIVLLSLLIGERDGLANQSLFKSPYGITVNSKDGSIYITEIYGHRIRKLFKVEWTKGTHFLFPHSTRTEIDTIVKMSHRRGTHFSKLPRDIIYVIIQVLSLLPG
jgi:hypothetical protein